jgi:hypothetical protein
MDKDTRNICFGLGLALILSLIFIAIRPAGLAVDEGFSYYGNFANTVIPYVACFVVYAFCLWKASELVRNKILVYSIRVMALMLIGLVMTPSNIINSLHMVFGTVLFVLQLLISFWIAGWYDRRLINIVLAVIELIGGLISFYYLSKPYGILLQGQAIFQLAFAFLLVVLIKQTRRA